jgi:Ser/Thr protein kinase RdoA (MazF antagonist)
MNVLAIGRRVTAVLDFEFAQPDARLIDVVSPLVHVIRLWKHETTEAMAMAAAFCAGFRRTGALDNAEIAALPQTMLLRNIAVAIWWFGRDLDVGRADSLERLSWLRKLADWLAEHGDELRDLVRESRER